MGAKHSRICGSAGIDWLLQGTIQTRGCAEDAASIRSLLRISESEMIVVDALRHHFQYSVILPLLDP